MRGFRPILLLVPTLIGVGFLFLWEPTTVPEVVEPHTMETIEEKVPAAPPIRDEALFDSVQPSPAGTPVGRQTYVPVQARPIIALLQAVEQGDLKSLPALYAPHIRTRIEKTGWADYAGEIETVMLHFFGTMDPDVLTFIYRGDAEQGKVQILFPGGKSGKTEVVLLDDRWVLNEL